MNIRNYKNVIRCFDTNFEILFDESNLTYTKSIPSMLRDNQQHGFRTLNKMFDNPYDFHSATIAHHDLSSDKDKQHFKRAITRLNYIKDHNIPILFINISMEYDNTYYDPVLVESIIKYGIKNMKILSIYKTNTVSEIQLVHISEYMIIYKMPTYGYDDIRDDNTIKGIIQKHFICDKLMNIVDFPNNSEFISNHVTPEL